MKLLYRISIAKRIILLALLPSLIVGGYAALQLNTALNTQRQLNLLAFAMQLAKETSDVHLDMQAERDLTQGFISGESPGEQGKKYRSRLIQQRSDVDKHLSAFRHFVSEHQPTIEQLGLSGNIDGLESMLTHLSPNRRNVDSLTLFDSEGMHVLWRYTYINTELLKLIHAVLGPAANDADLAMLSGSYTSMVLLENRLSRERSEGLSAFNRPTVGYDTIGNNMAFFRQVEDSNMRIFAYAPGPIAKLYWEQYVLSDVQQRMDGLRREIMGLGGKPGPMSGDQWFELATQNKQQLREIIHAVEQSIDQVTKQKLSDAADQVWANLATLIVALALVGVTSFFIVRSITSPLNTMVATLSDVARDKALATRLPTQGKDELSALTQAFNSLMNSFNSSIVRVRDEAQSIRTHSDQVVDAMERNLSLADSQNHATDSVSVAVNQMTSTIQEVATLSQTTAEVVGDAHQRSIDSAEKTERSQSAMTQLLEDLSTTQQQVQQLNLESEEISSIITVIQGIAEQTNLLALNAAIEAARAGEQGRGFAVVADEVRSLANKTQSATLKIQTQIESLQNGSTEASQRMEQLRQQGSSAVEHVADSAEDVAQLKAELDRITEMATQIATAAEEQTAVADEINQQIHQIKDDTEQLYQQSNGSVAVSKTLKQSGAGLMVDVEQFQLG